MLLSKLGHLRKNILNSVKCNHSDDFKFQPTWILIKKITINLQCVFSLTLSQYISKSFARDIFAEATKIEEKKILPFHKFEII